MIKQSLFILAGWLSLAAGFIGIFLPLLPTTPFVLLAAYCFSKGSKKLHLWLYEHPWFGDMIKDWEKHGAISLKIKCLSTSMILVMISYPLFFKDFSLWLKTIIVITIAFTLSFIWTRPHKKVNS